MQEKKKKFIIIPAALFIILITGGCNLENQRYRSDTGQSPELLPAPSWLHGGQIVIDANVGLGRFASGAGREFAASGTALEHLRKGGIIGAVVYSGLSQEELHDICSGNILRLIGIRYENDSFLLKPPSKREILDLHVHHGKINPVPTGTETAEGIVRNMERCGLKAAIITSVRSCFGEVKRGNKAVSEACALYPGRLFGYLTLDPKYPEEIQSEFALYGENPAFRGIKLHTLHGVDIADQRHNIIFSFADKKGWFLLCHASGEAAKWEKICNTFKNANFIVAHHGASDPDNPATVRLAELARKTKNLCLVCGSSGMTQGALERLAEIAGADHLTYGSDFQMFDFGYETGRIFCSSLTEDEKNLIFYGNAEKLLGL